MRSRCVLGVLAVLATAVAGCCGWMTLGTVGSLFGLTPSNLELMATAEGMVAPEWPQALLIEVLGAPSSGSAQTAADVDRWQFRFSEDPNVGGSGTVWVDYENGQFAGPFYTQQGLVGTEYVALPRTMSLADALQLARNAGFNDAFTSVTYRTPLIFPPADEALYALGMPGQWVLVGAVSGEVTAEANRDEPTFLTP
jgi:hypothetical protein